MKDRELPSAARRGKLIEQHNPQPEVRKNVENDKDWEYKDDAAFLNRMAVLFKDRLVDPLYHTDRARVPDPVISFDNLRNNNTLAAYTLARNPQGLLHEITFNTSHYFEENEVKVWKYGRWAQLETLLHELKPSGILWKNTPREKSSSLWSIRWTSNKTTIQEIKFVKAAIYHLDTLTLESPNKASAGWAVDSSQLLSCRLAVLPS